VVKLSLLGRGPPLVSAVLEPLYPPKAHHPWSLVVLDLEAGLVHAGAPQV
jgi:hypothetical protein